MNRFNWTYVNHKSERHNVGLMHGAQSGNLLVYCNTEILLIDFLVHKSKSYSFFIEEELCELSIERIGDQQYLYSFDLNMEADTPLNRRRKQINKKHFRQSLAFLGAFMLLVLSVTIGFNYWGNNNSQYVLAYLNKGKETVARISIEEDAKGQLVTYFFVADGKNYTAKSVRAKPKEQSVKNGMPLEKGDEFMVKYVGNNPRVNEIDYTRPSPNQLAIYKKRAIDQHLKFHPELDRKYCSCVAEIAYQKAGINGLADLYFQHSTMEENPQHNSTSYKRMVREAHFIQAVEEKCWD